MEKFFIVKNEVLAGQVKEFESMRKKVDAAFGEFAKEHGIETSRYYQHTSQLRIVPSEKDIQKFMYQLKIDKETFKKNSAINKAWVELCKAKELKTPNKPVWELAELIDGHNYRFRSRLFSLNGEVHGSFESDCDFTLPEEHFVELKASEFYKIIEDSNE